MKDYFAAELRALRESAQEFAEQYPEQAGQLNINSLRDWDPYVERLLEGTAFLTAQIQQRLDDDIPEICETLLMQLWPQMLRPFPAATILQFQPLLGALQGTEILPKNITVQSQPVGENKTICEFKTTKPLKINSLKVNAISVSDSSRGGSLVTLSLESTTNLSLKKLDLSHLTLYLDADPAIALEAYYGLVGSTEEIQVLFPENPTFPEQILSDKHLITGLPFALENILNPASGRSFCGFHLLQEYFCFRENFLFIVFHGLEKINFPENSRKIVLKIQTKNSFAKGYNLSPDFFKTNCVPAINLFQCSSEPIRLTHLRVDYPIIPDGSNEEGVLLYSLEKVTGINDVTGQRQEYGAFNTFQHRGDSTPSYQLTQRTNGKNNPAYFLIMSGENSYQQQTISCEITACNGSLPRRFLTENMLTIPGKDFPSLAQVSNILRPTTLYLPPKREHWRWALIMHMSLNIQAIQDLSSLKQLLSLYDWTGKTDNQRRINGIEAIVIKPVRRVEKGILFSGLEFDLILQEQNYLSLADIYLFGEILHQFFSMYVPINTYASTKICCYPSNKEFLWQTPLSSQP